MPDVTPACLVETSPQAQAGIRFLLVHYQSELELYSHHINMTVSGGSGAVVWTHAAGRNLRCIVVHNLIVFVFHLII